MVAESAMGPESDCVCRKTSAAMENPPLMIFPAKQTSRTMFVFFSGCHVDKTNSRVDFFPGFRCSSKSVSFSRSSDGASWTRHINAVQEPKMVVKVISFLGRR